MKRSPWPSGSAGGFGRSISAKSAAGPCEIGGRKWIFLDIALSPPEQFEQLLDALRGDPAIHVVKVPPALQQLLGVAQVVRRAA